MDDRSLKEMLLESADDLEAIVKQVMDSVLNREKSSVMRSGETVTNLVVLFDAKQREILKLLARVPEFQAREQLIRELKECVKQRDDVIQTLEMNLKACEVALTTAMFQANQKLKAVREAELRPVNSETVVKLAHQISRSYSVSAPLTWQQGDPSRPFPQEHEFRSGWLLNPKAMQTSSSAAAAAAAVPAAVGLLRQPNQPVRTPPVVGKASAGSPAVFGQQVAPQSTQKIWSPRTGYGPPPSTSSSSPAMGGSGSGVAPIVKIGGAVGGAGAGMATDSNGGLAPNQMNKPGWTPAPPTVSPFVKKGPVQSPLVSPNVKVKITGMTRGVPPPLRNVEQMSSDDSSESSSEDEGPKRNR